MDLAVLTRLKEHIKEVPRQFLAMPDEQLKVKPSPNKWSKMEILGHLIDSARYNLMRFTEISFLPHPYPITSYHQNDLVRVQAYQSASADNLCLTWQALNQQIVQLILSYPPKAASWPLILPNGEERDFSFLVKDYVEHLEHHLNQLFNKQAIFPSFQRSFSIVTSQQRLADVPTAFVELARDGNWTFEYYAPQGVDLQQPHDRDEVYFICRGTGMFVNGDQRHPFQPGDMLFVPAGVIHRFEDFSKDFSCWVVFGGMDYAK